MATPVVANNGIFMRDTGYETGSHIDAYHLKTLMKDVGPMDMGPIDIWAMSQKVEMPLYQMSSFGGKNTILVPGLRGEWKWQTPISQDLPYVLEDIEPTNTTKGIDGTTFRVKLNRQEFGHSDLFTYDKYNGLEMYVTSDPILRVGDGYIYTVKLLNNGNATFLNNKYLTPQTKMFRCGSIQGEYPDKYADMTVRGGGREFYNFVGEGMANASFDITSTAALWAKNGKTTEGALKMVNIWQVKKDLLGTDDASIYTPETIEDPANRDYMRDLYQRGALSYSFVTAMEAAHMAKVAADIEFQLMWGKGGQLMRDGADAVRMSVGLWKQLDSAYKRIYNYSSFTIDMFRAELYNFYAGRVEFTGPDSMREIVVQTGIAGMQLINTAIAKEAGSAGYVIQAAENNGIGAIKGQGMKLSYGSAFIRIQIPFLANLTFQINSAFDNVNTNDIENPLINGYPLSSYSFIIFDVTDNTDNNIVLLKKEIDSELRWRYINGTFDYLGRNGFQSSGDFSGFKMRMEQAYQAVWVKDSSKLLKIVMKNPVTGLKTATQQDFLERKGANF